MIVQKNLKQKAETMEPSFVQFLRLLGFSLQEESNSKQILSSDLFILPNKDAFQKVRAQKIISVF